MPHTLIKELSDALFSSAVLKNASEKFDLGHDVIVGVPMSARPFFVASAFSKRPRATLVVVSGEEAAYLFTRDLAAWLGNDAVMQMPLRSDLPWKDLSRDANHVHQAGNRARAINALATGEPVIVVTSARALIRCVPPPPKTGGGGVFAPLQIKAEAELPTNITYEQLADILVGKGYERLDKLDLAEAPGCFSIHGDTIDIYPAGLNYPVRIELFGDYVEVVRRLVPSTGQSIGTLDHVDIYPARELELNEKTKAMALRKLAAKGAQGNADDGAGDGDTTFFASKIRQHYELIGQGVFFNELERYLPYLYDEPKTPLAYLSSDAMVALIEPRSLFDDSARYFEELESSARIAKTPLGGLFTAPSQLDFGSQQRLTLLSLISSGANLDARLEVKHADTSSDERLAASARGLLATHFLTVLSSGDRQVRSSAELVFSDAHLPFKNYVRYVGEAFPQHDLDRKVINIADTDMSTSLIIPGAQLAILAFGSTGNMKSATSRGRRTKTVDPTALTFPFKPGDYVVHATHGIALFKEIVRQEVGGVERDYLYLEYSHQDKLFTPVEQIDKITRYVGPESSSPRLTRLNTSDWSRATGKARSAARKLAFDLVDLYARRSAVQGYAYAPDNEQQYQMELSFPYEETPDQLSAITDVKADMESARPMDRLICGDVGFGKTEVALRAAFKAVQSGKQVMLLCPTTILAQQHYTNFYERFNPFAVSVEVLSRFRSGAEQKRILESFAKGVVDVLVGTHRLLSADVNPKELGLIIIDEEQRFGVGHKEQLKNLREQVDVLTLSATPIPRTMQMAISGVRDMSLIDTPPASRTPIKVHVGEWDEDVVSAAIRQEMGRGGQVYYVSNRVKTIDDAVARVIETAPEARIGTAHGKMTAKQLENVMESFAANEYDVLVATTIIESGLDNPHTNTLIIEDSQRLGLAQLYQLKGRVGRSHAQAYAYFLFPSQSALTEEAVGRLEAIDEFQELGSGMKIAMRDLEIRGAGSLLGAEQHGMLSAVGFDLFASMLQEAVLAARVGSVGSGAGDGGAGDVIAHPEVKIDLPVPFLFPEEYIAAADERVLYYRKLAAISEADGILDIEKQLEQKYGAMPESARNLVDRALAKALAGQIGMTNISTQRGKLVLEPVELSSEQAADMKLRGAIYMVKSKRLMHPIQEGVGMLNALINLLKELGKHKIGTSLGD